MQKLNSKTLNTSLKKYKIEDKVKQNQLLIMWEKVINDFLPHVKEKTMAVAFEKGVLRVAALSREIAYEINLYARRIMQELNNLLGKNLVFRIICEA